MEVNSQVSCNRLLGNIITRTLTRTNSVVHALTCNTKDCYCFKLRSLWSLGSSRSVVNFKNNLNVNN